MTRRKNGKWSAMEDEEAYQNFISSELRKVDDLREQELDVKKVNIQINKTLKKAQKQFKTNKKNKEDKLTQATKNLISKEK